MKKLAAGLIAAGAVWLAAQTQTAPNAAALDRLFPPGPAIFVETRDLAALIRDWNVSAEKASWLKSDNYTVFSRTRLFQRLAEAQAEFSAAAGFEPDYPFATSIAGGESAVAIYDIGKLEFLYVTRLPGARLLETALGKVRTSYESRSVAGQTYYLRENRENRRTAAFAAVNGLLVLATREDLIAQALTLLSSSQGSSMRGESWYQTATAASKGKGEIRMVMNMPQLLEAPQFRAYWVQKNVSELRQYASAVADVFRETAGVREERVFVREQPAESKAAAEAALGRLLPMAPAEAGLYRGWASPSREQVRALLMRKLAAPGAGGAQSESAPGAAGGVETAGSEADLETRIDQPPLVRESGSEGAAIESLLAKQNVQAMLLAQGSRTLPGGVFVVTPAVIVLLAASNWDEAALRAALPDTRINVRGPVAVLGNDETLTNAVAARMNAAPTSGAGVYAAGFRTAQELPSFTRQMRLIDAQRAPRDPGATDEQSEEGREPEFFSENIPSLGRSFSRYAGVTSVMHDDGARVPQTVRYSFAAAR